MAGWRFWRRPKQLTQGQTIAQAIRRDAWANIYSRLGKKGADKRTGGEFEIEPVSSEEARFLWLGDPLAKKIIEVPPADAMRRGYVVKTDDKVTTTKIQRALKKLGVNREFTRAKQFERAYGGAALFPYINDGGDITTELDETAMTMPEHLTLFEPRELYPLTWYRDPQDEHYGKVEIYRVIPIATFGMGGVTEFQAIHSSRLVIFPGIRVSRQMVFGAEPSWGGNILTQIKESLRDLNMSWAGAAALIQDFSQAVIKIKGLGALIDNNEDDAVIDRVLQLDLSRSIIRAMVIDKDDDFHREQTPMSGLPEILIQFMTWFAAKCDMSVVRLFGVSPAGLNATGESDILMGDDKAEASQQEHLPQLEQIVRMTMLATDGPTDGKEPDEWSIEFNPLRTPSAMETAEERDVVATSDERYVKMGAVSADEVAHSRWGGDAYSPEMMIDWEARKKQAAAMPTPYNAPPQPGSSLPIGPDGQPQLPTGATAQPPKLLPAAATRSPSNGVKKTPPP